MQLQQAFFFLRRPTAENNIGDNQHQKDEQDDHNLLIFGVTPVERTAPFSLAFHFV